MEKLNFGSLCNLIYKWLRKMYIYAGFPLGGRQNQVIYLLYRSVETDDFIESYISGETKKSYASKIFNNCRSVPAEIVYAICDKEKENTILSYIKDVFLYKVFWDELISDLSEFVDGITVRNNLESHLTGKDAIDKQARFFLECMQYAVSVPNDFKAELKKQRKTMIKKYDEKTGDPFGLNKIDSNSKALCITIEGDFLIRAPFNVEEGILYFHHFESCLEFIIKEGLVILKVEALSDKIRVLADKQGFELQKIRKEQYADIVTFLKPYDEVFEKKLSWGMGITALAEQGFKEEKWIPYAYIDKGKIIAFCDYKHRVDRDIEIGIVLVDEPYRGIGLAESLLYLFRLKFFASDIFSGTHQNNYRMIEKFKNAGFKELIFLEGNEKVLKGTNMIRDRVNDKAPFSKYYTAEALWKNDKAKQSVK